MCNGPARDTIQNLGILYLVDHKLIVRSEDRSWIGASRAAARDRIFKSLFNSFGDENTSRAAPRQDKEWKITEKESNLLIFSKWR